MKIQYKSKIKKILLVLVLVITCFLMKSNGRTFASSNDEIQVSFAELNDQFFTQSTINISAKGVVDNIKILSITLPNATIVDGSFASYETHINGENKFIVRYIETSLESNQSNEIQEFECSYNVTTLKEKEEVAEEIEKKDSSNNNEINAASPLEDPIDITYESTYNEDNQNYLISAIVKPKNDDVKINSMELPDGTVVEGDVVGYNTKEEIDLTFKINCEDKISSEEKQIVSTFKFEDKDIKTIKNAKLDANGVPYTPEDWFDFDSNTGTITKIKNVMYWDVNWASNPSSPAENFNNGVINIPPTINGVEVKRIGYRAFANNYDSERLVMDAIIFPDTLTTIDQYGAHGIYLLGDSYLKLPENLSSMSILSFGGLHCKGITFPKNLKFSSIGTEFQGVELDGGNGTLDIPEGITSIGENAFMFSNFKKLIMPTSWVSSGRYMFSRTTIRKADFSKCTELTSISEGMFSSSSLTNLDLSACKKLTTIGVNGFLSNQLESVLLPANLERILMNSFANNKIKNVNLADTNVSIIDSAAFEGNLLEKLTLPKNLRNLGGRSFANNKLSKLDVSKIEGTSESDPLYLGPVAFGRDNQLFYLDFGEIYVATRGTEKELVYDPINYQWVYRDISGNVLSDNNVKGVAYIDINGDNIVPIDTLFPGIKIDLFSIDFDRTLGVLSNLGLDVANPNVLNEYMPIYNKATGYIKLPTTEVMNRKIMVDGVEKVVKDVYGFVYKYIVGSNYYDVNGNLLYSDGGSFINVSKFASGVKVTYHSNDGAGEKIWTSAGLEGELLSTKPASPTRVDYDFTGWYTSPDANPASKWDFNTDVVGKADFDLYAGWELKKEIVSFDANGGTFISGSTSMVEVIINTVVGAAMSEKPTLNGFIFEGWYTKSDGSGKQWDLNKDYVTKSFTLYAKWKFDDTIQNPSILLSIPKKIELKDDVDRRYATGHGEIKTVDGYPYEQWLSTSVIEIKSDTTISLRNDKHADMYSIDIIKSDGTRYTNANQALMNLNMKGVGNPKSDTFKLSTSIQDKKLQGIYDGVMTFYITIHN